MPVLVTGATGLLGSHLVDLLLERGELVRALLRPSSDPGRLARRGVEVYEGDLGDRRSLEAAVRGVDRVFHCAGRTGVWGPRSDYEVANVLGPRILLEAALSAGVRRFTHVSSVTVHGVDVNGTADETAPFRFSSDPYSWSKILGERQVWRLIEERRAPVTIVRPGLIYGSRDVGSLARFAAAIQRRGMVVIGRGDNHLPLIHVRDVAEGMLQASKTERAVGQAYILVNDEPVTQNDYLSAIAASLGVPRPSRHVPFKLALGLGAAAEHLGHLTRRRRPPPLTRFGVQVLGGENRFAIDKARREIGFSPKITIAEGIPESVHWYLNRGDERGRKEGEKDEDEREKRAGYRSNRPAGASPRSGT